MIAPDHPAVEAAATSYARTSPARTDALQDMSAARREQFLRRAHQALTAALPCLTAATQENVARLRNTPAGRALMAEAWQEGAMTHAEATSNLTTGTRHIINETMRAANPYREETPNE